MYTYKVGIDTDEHDNFIKTLDSVNLLQSSAWAQVKNDSWDSETIGFYKDDKLVASASLLIRSLPLGYTMIYVPRGPIIDYTDKELVNFITDSLKKYGKTKRALFVKVDPMISIQSINIENEVIPNDDAQKIISNIKDAGAQWSGQTDDMAATIQPRFNAVTRKEDFVEEKLTKKTKQALRKARKVNPIIKIGKDELVDDFSILMKKTEERKNIKLRNADYYKKLLSLYDDAYITLVYLDFEQLLKDAQENLNKATNDKLNAVTKNEKKLKQLDETVNRFKKDVDEYTALIKEHGNIIPAAGGLTINFANSAEHLYAGTDTTFQKLYPAYLAWYESIKHCFDIGAETVNLGGLENSLSENDGLLKFKKHFNPTIEESIGEFDIPVNKLLFSLSENAYKIRKKLKSSH